MGEEVGCLMKSYDVMNVPHSLASDDTYRHIKWVRSMQSESLKPQLGSRIGHLS